MNPSPVTGVCQLVDRAESATSNIGVDIDYDLGWGDLEELANHNEAGSPLGAHAASGFLGTIPPQDLYSGRTSDTLSETANLLVGRQQLEDGSPAFTTNSRT